MKFRLFPLLFYFIYAQCNNISTTSASLRQHEIIHIKEKTFSCTHCDYKSTTSASLKEHKAIYNPKTSFCGWTDSEAAECISHHCLTECNSVKSRLLRRRQKRATLQSRRFGVWEYSMNPITKRDSKMNV